MALTRAQAFSRIRDVIGPEVCPAVRHAADTGDTAGLEAVRATAEKLRHALAATMRKLDGARPCPNCEAEPCKDRCVLRRLMENR